MTKQFLYGLVFTAVSMLVVGIATASANANNIVLNGDFSSNGASFTNFPGYTGGSNPAAIDDWTKTGGGQVGVNGVGIHNPFGPANKSAATYYGFLQNSAASLTQTVTGLSPNTTYYVSFVAANRNRSADADAQGRVLLADNSNTYYDSGSNTWSTAAFQTVSAEFTTGSSIDGPVVLTLSNESPAGDKTVDYSNIVVASLDDPVVLFYDDFDSADGTSLTDPLGRATGILGTRLKYTWTNTNDVVVDGTLNWDSNGDRNDQHQHAANGTQNVRFSEAGSDFDWSPYVAGKRWEVEFDQRVGWSHPLTFGLSDNPQNGNWAAWSDGNYDFAAGSYGTRLGYDTDNDDPGVGLTPPSPFVGGAFPNPPSSQDLHHFRIQFDEPNNTVTLWLNGVQKLQETTLDFENPGRYLTWGEPTNYAGALDNIKVSLVQNVIPEPLTMLAVGLSVAGLGGYVRKRRRG